MRPARDAEYTEYVRARLPWLRRVAYLLCQDWQRADDLAQTAITRLYTHWSRARSAANIDAYARTVLIRIFLAEQRSGWARRVTLAPSCPDRLARTADVEAGLDVRAALHELPPRQRATLVLRFYCDLSVEEAAAELGCTQGTVKSQTAKGLSALRRVLAPARFAVLTPYADFGWLPDGFSEAAAGSDLNGGPTVTATSVSRQAADNAAGHFLSLNVNARADCRLTRAGALREMRLRHFLSVACGSGNGMSFKSTRMAPDVNGHLAFWVQYGAGIVWEYAPGAWASIQASITPAADEPHSRRFAAESGWVLAPRDLSVRMPAVETPARIQAAIRAGKLVPPSAATRALLVRIASHVRYGQRTPLLFPFRLPGPLPAGWTLAQAQFRVDGGRLIGTNLQLGPAVDPMALGISAVLPSGQQSCPFFNGESSYLTSRGVQFVYRQLNEVDKRWEYLCTTGTIDGLTPSVALDMNVPGSSASLWGSERLGGARGVLSRLRFLGTSPGGWTTTPLG